MTPLEWVRAAGRDLRMVPAGRLSPGCQSAHRRNPIPRRGARRFFTPI
jgi:hypothetical protein